MEKFVGGATADRGGAGSSSSGTGYGSSGNAARDAATQGAIAGDRDLGWHWVPEPVEQGSSPLRDSDQRGLAAVPLVRSTYVQSVVRDGRAVAWHSLFGHPQLVSADTLELLNFFSEPMPIAVAEERYELDVEGGDVIAQLLDNHFLIPVGLDERALLAQKVREREHTITSGSRVDYLELIVSEACNFRCTYCIHFNNLETGDRLTNSVKVMKWPLAQKAVDDYLDVLKGHGKIVAEINFGGGEPLIAWPIIERVMSYCIETYQQEFTFRFSLNTNASLITGEIAETLKRHKVRIAVSLDGLQEGNDSVRLTKSGGGTFAQITRGIDTLAEAGYPIDGVAVTVNEHNLPFIDERVIDWAVCRNMVEVRIDIDVVGMVEIPVETIVERLMSIRRYARGKNVEIAGFWSRPAENLNEPTLLEPVAFCGAVRGNSMCVSPSGKVYGCGYSNIELGQLIQLDAMFQPDSPYHSFVRSRETGAMEMCRGCMIEGQCGGGCNITQEFARATQTAKIDRMCDFYRAMTTELLLEQLEETEQK